MRPMSQTIDGILQHLWGGESTPEPPWAQLQDNTCRIFCKGSHKATDPTLMHSHQTCHKELRPKELPLEIVGAPWKFAAMEFTCSRSPLVLGFQRHGLDNVKSMEGAESQQARRVAKGYIMYIHIVGQISIIYIYIYIHTVFVHPATGFQLHVLEEWQGGPQVG